MLVLTRKQNEQIRIGEDITITVIRTKGKAVRLGIQAPSNISVLRGELVFDSSDEAEVEKVTSKMHNSASESVTKNRLHSPVAQGSPFVEEITPKGEDHRRSTLHWSDDDSSRSGEESALGAATISAVTMRDFLDSRVGV
ncbi:MAG: carbon storage regulator [Lacipirellulaceae bacterium]